MTAHQNKIRQQKIQDEIDITVERAILAIIYPALKYLGGCFWLFYRLRRETPI